MANEQSAIDLSGLEDLIEWFKGHKNLLIGLLLVLLLSVAGTSFVRRELHESAVKPWRSVFAAEQPWSAPPDDLATAASSVEVKGTPAEPFLRYWEAVRRFEEDDHARAIEELSAFQRDFPNHPLVAQKVANPDQPADPKSVVARILAGVQLLDQWGKSYPVPTANPLPHPKNTVTLVTDKGKIVLALYDDLAPKSCEAFVKTAPLLKGRYIARSSAEQWVELGQEADGSNVTVNDPPAGFPPFEVNSLSHFPGSVSFRQPPFSKAPFQGDLRIDLKTRFEDDGHSTVFAWVADGLDVLKTIAAGDHKSGGPTSLSTPVQITDVQVEPFDPKKPPAGMAVPPAPDASAPPKGH
jgi:cyclophilin family peptidyl-prolyl cis-trans isomerase